MLTYARSGAKEALLTLLTPALLRLEVSDVQDECHRYASAYADVC
jgi:hypothetical protein